MKNYAVLFSLLVFIIFLSSCNTEKLNTIEDGFGDSDIYISFKQKDGAWGNAINLGDEINTNAWEASASITPDGKYLFFSRNVGSDNFENVDIFWVDAKIVFDLKTE